MNLTKKSFLISELIAVLISSILFYLVLYSFTAFDFQMEDFVKKIDTSLFITLIVIWILRLGGVGKREFGIMVIFYSLALVLSSFLIATSKIVYLETEGLFYLFIVLDAILLFAIFRIVFKKDLKEISKGFIMVTLLAGALAFAALILPAFIL